MNERSAVTAEVCAVAGCDSRVRCRKLCSRHYRKLLKYGDPTINRAPTRGLTLRERFERCVDSSAGPDACWPWTARRFGTGYGQVWVREIGRADGAHRVAWRLEHGEEIPPGLQINHHCDNRPCCNPAHLYLGDQSQNLRDAVRRGRQVIGDRRGQANSLSKLTDEKVREIRRLHEEEGVGTNELGRRYGVSHTAIRYVLTGRAWAHVR